MMDPRARQASYNAASRDHWAAFASHRECVNRLLGTSAAPDRTGRLAVLGAGNTNDLDLRELLARYREVQLFDLDGEALKLGALRQGVADDPRLVLQGGVDLTGMLDAIGGWGPLTVIRPPDLKALAEWPATRVAPALTGPFEVVASTCLLSQLIATVRHALGEARRDFQAVVSAIRLGHLRLLSALTAPGGEGWLITDALSTDIVPELRVARDVDLPGLLDRAASEGRIFHGADPSTIQSCFREDAWLAARTARVERFGPWRWSLHERVYLVWALKIRRAGEPSLLAAGRFG